MRRILLVYACVLAASCQIEPEARAPHADCEIATVGVKGGEDVAVTPLGLIGSFDDRRSNTRGSLRLLSIGPQAQLTLTEDLTGGRPTSFHPHGLGAVTVDGVTHVMVVNHPQGWLGSVSTIEVYRQQPDGALVHIRTVQAPNTPRLNDVLPVSSDVFYATNETRAEHGALGEALQFILRHGNGTLIFHDGSGFSDAATHFGFANSVERTANGDLAVSDSVRHEVRLFEGDLAAGDLSEIASVSVDGGPDNLTLTADGDLLMVTHDRLSDYAHYAAKGEGASPWSLRRLSFGSADGTVATVFSSNGEAHPAMSVGMELSPGRYFIGSIFDEGQICSAER